MATTIFKSNKEEQRVDRARKMSAFSHILLRKVRGDVKGIVFLYAGIRSLLGISQFASLDIGISIGKEKIMGEHL